MKNDLSVYITIFLLCITVMVALRIFWPILIVLGVLFLVGYFKSKHEIKKAEEEARKEQEDLESQLFEEQVKRKKRENAEIIEAEFTEKEDNSNDYNKG